MSEPSRSTPRATTADVVSARATGVGAGLVAFMVTWLIGNRVTGLVWEPPAGPVVAMIAAVAAGVLVAVLVGARLVRSLATE